MLDIEVVPDLVCGRTYREQRPEDIVAVLRTNKGQRVDGGCGRAMSYLHTYRCLECGRWMHGDCLKAHFAEPVADA